jgi:hypothetical protein
VNWPWRELEGLLAGLPALPAGPAAMLELAVRTAGNRVLGRRLTMRVGESDVSLTPVELDIRLETLGIALGQVGHVRITAEDVTWPDAPLRRLAVFCDDVRLSSLPTPSVVAGTVEVVITVTAEVVRAKAAEAQPNLDVDIGPDGIVRVSWARKPHWGNVEVEASVEEAGVVLTPKVLTVGGHKFGAVRRLRPTVLEVPDLPRGLRLIAVQPGPGELVLRGVTERWRERIPVTEVLSWLTTTVANS